MITTIDDKETPCQCEACEFGMELRDRFATAALTGLLTSDAGHFVSTAQSVRAELGASLEVPVKDCWLRIISKWSYEYADAMLAAREVKS